MKLPRTKCILVLAMMPALFAMRARGADMTTNSAELSLIRQVLREVPLVDGHNDLPWQYRLMNKDVADINLAAGTSGLGEPLVTDIPRLRAGGVGAQFWSAYVPPTPGGAGPVQMTLEQIDLIRRLCARYPADLELALTADDIERIHRQGRIASLIGLEGGHCINNSLATLRMFYELGARYLTLTHVKSTDWADAAGDVAKHHGLTVFGKEVLREMNRLGMLFDLSHVTDEVMRDALEVTKAPVIFSHSSARGVCDSTRNVPDDVLQAVRANGGIVMVCFLPGYLNEASQAQFLLSMKERERLEQLYPNEQKKVYAGMAAWRKAHPAPKATLEDVVRHIEHIRKVAGIEHVGIGSDFEGYHGVVEGLEDVSYYPALLAELARRGYTREELEQVAGLNFLRVFRQVEKVAATLKAAGY